MHRLNEGHQASYSFLAVSDTLMVIFPVLLPKISPLPAGEFELKSLDFKVGVRHF